jgi:peptidoglycan glycosyltransferase
VNISSSIRRLTNLFIILFVMLSGGLVYWQVVVAQPVTSNTYSTFTRHCLSDSAPMRGRILDRNGVVLAYSKPSNNPNLCGYQRIYTDPSLAGLIGYYISPLFGSTGIEKQYDDYLSGRLGSTGLDNTLNKTLHRPTMGDDIYLTIDEKIQHIVTQYVRDDPAQFPPDNRNGFATDKSSVIVTNPHTGEILAMLSTPGYDPNRIAAADLNYFRQVQTDPEQPLLERPLQARYVPGSTYKTVTLLAGLDSGNWQLSDQFDQTHARGPIVIGPPNGNTAASCTNCTNPVQYGQTVCIVLQPHSCGDGSETFGPVGNNLGSYTHNYPVDVRYGFVHSDNIIYAQIGTKTGAATWLKYNRAFYVGQQPPFDLPVAPSSVLPQGKTTLSVAQLAENSFGQGVDFVTPFQMSLFDDAVANNGDLMRPWLVMKIVDPTNASVVQSFSQQNLGSKIKADTARQMRDAMYGVIRCGSGSLVQKLVGSPWSIAGKTGTGEVGGGRPAQAWLLTQAPYNPGTTPALTIIAMRENGGEGSYLNGPITADIYNAIFTNQSILSADSIHVPTPYVPDGNYCNNTGLLQG